MKRLIYRQRNCKSLSVIALFIFLLLGIVNSVAVLAAEDDDYLKAIEMEIDKVDAKPSGGGAASEAAGKGFSSGMTIEEFEEELATKYTGTARFYEKLPRRTQQEIYQEYKDGASISEVRTKVMNRFLRR